MPKFGISMPKVKGPAIDLSLSKKDVDVTLPEAKAEVNLPDVELKDTHAEIEIKGPEIKTGTKGTKGSPSKYKMPSFKFPKFGVNIAAPSIGIEGPSIDHEGKGSKFKLPSLGFSGPQIKGPDIDLSFSKKDVDVTIPEAKAEVKLPSVEVKQPEVEVKLPEGNVELEGQESKFKMPKFGISMPKIKGPEIDLSLSKKDVDVTLPEAKAEVKLPDVKLKDISAEIEIKGPEIKTGTKGTKGSPSKYKMPSFKFPKFGGGSPSATIEVQEKDIKIDGVDIKIPKEVLTVDIAAPIIDIEGPSIDHEGKGSKFKLPSLGFTGTQIKGPEIDLSLSKKDVNVTLPEAKANVKLPDVKLKDSSAEVEIKGPGIDAQTRNVEGPSTTFRMPTFTLPKFGSATPKVSVDVPDVDEDIKVNLTAPSIDTEDMSVDMMAKGSELEVSGSKFKMPKFGISMSKVKGPEIDLSFSKKDVDVTLPEAKAEVKLPSVEVKQPEVEVKLQEEGNVEVEQPEVAVKLPEGDVELEVQESKFKMPKFGISMPKVKGPEIDLSFSKKDVDVTLPEVKAEVKLPSVEVKQPSATVDIKAPEIEVQTKNVEGSPSKYIMPTFTLPKFGSHTAEVSVDVPDVDEDITVKVTTPSIDTEGLSVEMKAKGKGQVIVKQPELQIKVSEPKAELDGQGSKLKFPKFGMALPRASGPGGDLHASQEDSGIEVKETSASVEMKASETQDKSKDVRGSPLKFKMPTLKMPKFGTAAYDVEAPDAEEVAERGGDDLQEKVTVNIKGLTVGLKTEEPQAAITDSETPNTGTEAVDLSSPSKFKLPLFKMPTLSFTRGNSEGEHVPVHTERTKAQREMKVEPKDESKSPKGTFTSFAEILESIDVESDVPETPEHRDTLKEGPETDGPGAKQLGVGPKETKQEAVRSPERAGWFKFPTLGLSSPSESVKDAQEGKSPVEETLDEETSPSCSMQSSDAFADISSAMTSERGGASLASPTKVTVRYSGPDAAAGPGEPLRNIYTTRTEMISVEPHLAEKITILSTSSSEDTLRLESGRIHVVTSNVRGIPEARRAELLAAVQVQSAGGLTGEPGAHEALSWTAEDSHGGDRKLFERRFVSQSSSERSETKETIVITQQITRRFDSSETVLDDAATSVRRLRDSVHSEKMRFFDGADE
ncbi:Neuroblast differentiation-associated protein AHNAK [Liparis tanakae]|uniref:Neuroblast differentiation-associated protein AHNAK n=1 Tax=Liparis tanakae TaxID=230148 RepID=A0A4Z2H633_9TELE|nr:Neuroblast differentiation-associated protein AHNAK [Liparis tanakae]